MRNASIQRTLTLFLQAVVILIGISAAAFLLWEPQVEGVNAHATNVEIYFQDSLLAYAYAASLFFFVILYQAFTLLGYSEQKHIISAQSVRALRTIQYCAMTMVPLIVIGVVWILSVESDDRPPILAMGLVTSFFFIAIATAAAMYARRVQNALNTTS
jgi:hypothetical protein